MKKASSLRGPFLFCLKFALIAPICMALWWWKLLPPYTWVLGQLSGGIINLFAEQPIEGMSVVPNPEGVLSSDTSLVYMVGGLERGLEVSDLVNSAVPFVILVLATGGLGVWRRIRILALGSIILFCGQAIFIVFFFLFAKQISESQEIGTALGQFFLTLPFAMWIVMAYWDRLVSYFGDDSSEERSSGETQDSAAKT